MVKLNLSSVLVAESKTLELNGRHLEEIIKAMHNVWPDYPLLENLDENPEIPAGLSLAQSLEQENGCFRALCYVKEDKLAIPLFYFVPRETASLEIMEGFSVVDAYVLDEPYAFILPTLSREDFMDAFCAEFNLHSVDKKVPDFELQLNKGYNSVLAMKEGVAVIYFEIVLFGGFKICKLWNMYLFTPKDLIEETTTEPRCFDSSFSLRKP